MTRDELEQIAKWHKLSSRSDMPSWASPLVFASLDIFVKPKERPRTGKSGHVYTPKETQDCEKKIAKFGMKNLPLLFHPIRLRLTFYEVAAQSKQSDSRWTRPTKGDLDNKVKTVTDALNGVLYRDDRQISSIEASRRYGDKDCLEVQVFRDGLSENEWDNVRKLIPHV